MTSRVLPFPVPPATSAAGGLQPGGEMHCRIEARRLAAFVLGPRPRVKILQIAWFDKKSRIDRFLNDFYAAHKCLPRGRHDLGVSENHGLSIGEIDFDRIRAQTHEALRRERSRARCRHGLAAVVEKMRWRPWRTREPSRPV